MMMAAILLTSCSTPGGGSADISDYCSLTEYVLVGEGDVLTDETARSILLHNELRQELCE